MTLEDIKAYCEEKLNSGWSNMSEVKTWYFESLDKHHPNITRQVKNSLWIDIVKLKTAPKLLAVQQVFRVSGTGQISLFHGDVFQLPSDQWICSAYQEDVNPSGGAWKRFWANATRQAQPWPTNNKPKLNFIDSDQQVATLSVNPKKFGGLPTIVLFGKYSRRYEQTQSQDRSQTHAFDQSWVEKVYFDTLCTCRILARSHKLGKRLACPPLFSEHHDIDFEKAIRLQRQFALDLLRQEPSIQEIMISVISDDQVDQLLATWHLASGDTNCIQTNQLPKWIQTGIVALTDQLRGEIDKLTDTELVEAIITFINRLEKEHIFINDLAVMARTIVEGWAKKHCIKAGMKGNINLSSLISQLRGRSGTPNRSIQYIDSIRELGNVGAHFQVAPHPLEPTDIVTILSGLVVLVKLDYELASTLTV